MSAGDGLSCTASGSAQCPGISDGAGCLPYCPRAVPQNRYRTRLSDLRFTVRKLPWADGGFGPGVDLRTGQLRRAIGINPDANLRNTITTGVPGTAMPPFRLSASELTMLVAYIRNMRDFDARAVNLGDAVRGKALFEGAAACTRCHRVNGKGPRVAPDLSDIGAIRSADALQQALLDPTGSILPSNWIRAVTRDGKVITGRRLNEDTHTVQLVDDGERLVGLIKADLREYSVNRESAMPSYKDKLTSQEVADIVAYVLMLKGQ